MSSGRGACLETTENLHVAKSCRSRHIEFSDHLNHVISSSLDETILGLFTIDVLLFNLYSSTSFKKYV
jgi:hypothetical protein